jgi:hypothetical protein
VEVDVLAILNDPKAAYEGGSEHPSAGPLGVILAFVQQRAFQQLSVRHVAATGNYQLQLRLRSPDGYSTLVLRARSKDFAVALDRLTGRTYELQPKLLFSSPETDAALDKAVKRLAAYFVGQTNGKDDAYLSIYASYGFSSAYLYCGTKIAHHGDSQQDDSMPGSLAKAIEEMLVAAKAA